MNQVLIKCDTCRRPCPLAQAEIGPAKQVCCPDCAQQPAAGVTWYDRPAQVKRRGEAAQAALWCLGGVAGVLVAGLVWQVLEVVAK